MDRYISDIITQQRLETEEHCVTMAVTLLQFADYWPRRDRKALANAINDAQARVEGLRRELGLTV